MRSKQRVSASVGGDLVDAGQAAVVAGDAESLSAWVNDALRRQVDQNRRLRALGEFLAAYEVEHGEITDDEVRDATRRARARAVIVRSDPDGSGHSGRRDRGLA